MYKIFLEKRVLKFLEKHKWEKIISQFEKSVDKLKLNPLNKELDIKILKWFEWKYRLRIWDFRFIYEINEKEIIIIFIYAWNRWDIYKKI